MDHNEMKKNRQKDEFFGLDPASPFRHVLHTIDDFFRNSTLKPNFRVFVEETENQYIVKAELPGIKKEQISIRTLHQSVVIQVTHMEDMIQKDDKKQTVGKKSSYQHMKRTIPLAHPIDLHRTRATYKDGLLKLYLPKRKGKRISIE